MPKKLTICIFYFLLGLPISVVESASSAKKLWAQHGADKSAVVLPFDLDQLGMGAIYFLYIFLMITAIFAFITIIKGGVGVLLSSGNYDSYNGSKQTFMSGFVTFVISVVVMFSLESILAYVKQLTSGLA